jgi:hypothetical protein
MIKLLGKTVCFLLRSHKWRRLRKGESSYIPAEQVPFVPALHRVCDRCKIVRAVAPRVRKAKAE